MRKAVKNNLLEIFKTIYEAHEIVKGFIEKKEYENAKNLLADCQDTAIQLGNLIEESEGEGFVTVSFLEEYCETLYEAATNLSEESNGHKVQKQLDKKIIKAENSAKNDIKVKLEIVFMPYKASMWDSLESVWKAADEDPDCDAYVVPIPYYDRNPDHSFGEFHYEGGDYPDYVPVVHYEAYNLEQRRPDVIYIHNPYDGNNLVTSVDPRFYSNQLKKYTDKLVYIPYYTTIGGMGEARRFAPVYKYSDYIVVQTEQYINYFDQSLPKNRFLPYGSPKFDRVINMCSNPPEPPAEWKEKIAGRKVYFYNTSISGLLQNTEVLLKKMQYVFETFAEHPEVCILWRPHPLLETTLDSMRPRYKKMYNALKEFFIKNNIGVYDDTSDITMSIALSDAYIGDSGSSVVSLFGVAGKPIFIFNNLINEKATDSDKFAENLRVFNNEWLITLYGNRLYRSEDKDYKYKYFCTLSDYNSIQYHAPIKVSDKYYALPINALDIVVLNESGIERRIPLNPIESNKSLWARYAVCGKYIFIFSKNYPAIIRFDTENNQLKYITENIDVIGYGDNRFSYGCHPAVCNGCVYIASLISNKMLIIDAESCNQKVITIKSEKLKNCYGISSYKNELWFIPHSGKTVISLNVDNNELTEYDMPAEFDICYEKKMIVGNILPFELPYVNDDYVYIPPYYGNMFIRINKVNKKAEKWKPNFEVPDEVLNGYYESYAKYSFINNSENELDGLFSVYDRKLYKIDNDDFYEIVPEIDVSDLEKTEIGFSSASQLLPYCCYENAVNSLEDLLKNEIKGASFSKETQIEAYKKINASLDGDCGEKVHQYIKEQLY